MIVIKVTEAISKFIKVACVHAQIHYILTYILHIIVINHIIKVHLQKFKSFKIKIFVMYNF